MMLALPSGDDWRFSVFGATLRLEESVYLADPKGARRSGQIVIHGQCATESLIRWSLKKDIGDHVPRVREVREGEREERILPQAIDPTGRPDDSDADEDDEEMAPDESPEPVSDDASEGASAAEQSAAEEPMSTSTAAPMREPRPDDRPVGADPAKSGAGSSRIEPRLPPQGTRAKDPDVGGDEPDTT